MQRKEEIEKKRSKLAELRKTREARKASLLEAQDFVINSLLDNI